MFAIQHIYNILNRDKGNLSEAPKEILFDIFSFLDDGQDLATIGRVCKIWYSVAIDHRLWENLVHYAVWCLDSAEFTRGFIKDDEEVVDGVVPCTRWKSMYIQHSEAMFETYTQRVEMKLSEKFPKLRFRTVGSKFQSYRSLEKMRGNCSRELHALNKRCEELDIVLQLKFSTSGGKLNLCDRSDIWRRYLVSDEIYREIDEISKKMKETTQADSQKDSEMIRQMTTLASEILNVTSISYSSAPDIISQIIEKESLHTFRPENKYSFKISFSENPLEMQIDGEQKKLNVVLSFTERDPRNLVVSRNWPVEEIVKFFNDEVAMHALELLVRDTESFYHEIVSENDKLFHKISDQLNLDGLLSAHNLSSRQKQFCLKTLLAVPPKLKQSIRQSHLTLRICSASRDYHLSSDTPVDIPWCATVKQLEDLLYYKPRYTQDHPIIDVSCAVYTAKFTENSEPLKDKKIWIFKELHEDIKPYGDKTLKRKMDEIATLERQLKKQKIDDLHYIWKKNELENEVAWLKALYTPNETKLYQGAKYNVLTLQ